MKRHIYFPILTGAWILLMISPAGAADLDVTFQSILDAPKTVSYQGTMTRQRFKADGDTLRFTQRVVHLHPDRDRIDLLEPEEMLGTIVIRIQDDVYRCETEKDSTVYTHQRRRGEDILKFGLGFSSLDLLQTNYDLIVQGQETILNRPTEVLEINPKHPGRFAKIVWVDQETGLALRVEDRDEKGNLVEEVFFSSIIINPQVDPSLFATGEWADRPVEERQVIACGSIQEVQKEAGFEVAAPVYIPAGFMLKRARVIPYANQPTVHFIYTDGLAQLSLYERVAPPTDKAAQEWPEWTPIRQDDVDVWKRGPYPFTILRRSDDGKLYTVISEISESESIKMIESLLALQAAGVSPPNYVFWFTGGMVIVGVMLGGWMWKRRRPLI